MRRSALASVILVLAALAAIAAVSDAREYEVGIVYLYDGTSGLEGSWGHGPGLVVGVVDGPVGLVHVDARVSWRPAAFDDSDVTYLGHIPEEHYGNLRGDLSHLFRASLGFRFGDTRLGPPYFSLRTGLLVAVQGRVEQDVWDYHDPDSVETLELRGPGEIDAEMYVAAGIGATFRDLLADGLTLEAEISTIPALGGVVFQGGAFALF